MRHKKHHTRLNRPTGHRKALLRNLTRAIVLSDNGRIETTVTKAKALRSFLDQMVTLGKKGTLHHRRQAFQKLQDKRVVHRIFEEIAPVFKDRNGGYTRFIRTRERPGDSAELAYIEFVEWPTGDETAEVEETETAGKA